MQLPPPSRETSRLTVEAARSRCLAISRNDQPEAIPPRGNNTQRMEVCGLSKASVNFIDPMTLENTPLTLFRIANTRLSLSFHPTICPPES